MADTPSHPIHTPDVLVVGEALVDIVHRANGTVDAKPGGSPANVALTLGRLERSPRLLTSLSNDAHGVMVKAWLEESSVAVEGEVAERTSTAAAHLDEHGAASYDFAITWDLGDSVSEGSPDALHIGSIAAVLAPGAEAVARLVERHRGRALISYDPNIRPSLVDDEESVRSQVAALRAQADVVKASDEDVSWLHPGEDVLAVARQWAADGPSLVVITLGSEGALAVLRGEVLRIPGVPVTVVDTVGAGDTFMGALIDGLLTAGVYGPLVQRALAELGTDDVDSILRRSAAAAAVTVSRPGADPPRRAELDG
ncbi:fructokinase [Microbacterium endophyticum]|uniref:Fructokinase n=1 Tax=Microbacterium endophyticum TaxID=1526412 RepID=A0A7W4V3H6_9MICO|nr:carbohydrate kinase [Microbacterium endophyticum]MBB2976152.1 fructokinase [Microbacterium endophyticum]NIK36449.1 fructokinase [Microbacterium endophyticum]